MDEEVNNWPDHYPKSCPPVKADGVSGNIYRFTNRNNPKHRDFQSYFELRPDEDWGNKACNARGLSVYSTADDCIAAAAAIPALRKKKVCVANLPNESGVIADTPSNNTNNHKTFWSLLSAEELSNLFEPTNVEVKTSV
jgi:hypothetical protein